MILLKPHRLEEGDVIGIVSPSSGLAHRVPHRVERGINFLKKMGFKVRLARHSVGQKGSTSGTPQERASDINDFFADPEIKAIFTTIGGYHTNQILEYLDFSLIQKNPKIVMGYSDATVLHFALQKEASLLTFYGPSLLPQFGEYPETFSYTRDYFLKAVCSEDPIGKIIPSSWWTDELLNWLKQEDNQRPRQSKKGRDRIWLREGNAEGSLNGGCITSLQHLRGTKYWPDFSGCLFFWEIPEGPNLVRGVSYDIVDSLLTDLALVGVFNKIAGMIVGRPYGYTDTEDQFLREIILERTKKYAFPILYNVEIGHTDPMITVPLGVLAKMNSEEDIFCILEPGIQQGKK